MMRGRRKVMSAFQPFKQLHWDHVLLSMLVQPSAKIGPLVNQIIVPSNRHEFITSSMFVMKSKIGCRTFKGKQTVLHSKPVNST